jgi:hypothetical protein
MPVKPLRLLGSIVGALVGYFAVQAMFSGGGVSVKDLRKATVAGITAELPGTPEAITIPIPPEIKAKVVSMESYQTLKKTFLAALSKVTYTPDIDANLDGALEGSVSNIMLKQQLTKVSEQRQPVTLSGIPAQRYSVLFSKSGDEFEMLGVIATRGPTMWNVFTFCKKGDTRSHDAAARIISSVELHP